MANDLQAYGSDPFQTFHEQVRDQMIRAISQIGSSQGTQQQGGHNITPLVDITEDDNGYRIIADVPGVEPQGVEVTVTGNTLSLRADRQADLQAIQDQQRNQNQNQDQRSQDQQRRRNILVAERRQGGYRREFRLPEDADRNRINAEVRNGVLTLNVPRSQEQHQRRRIEIKG